jgi:hypothetical protein
MAGRRLIILNACADAPALLGDTIVLRRAPDCDKIGNYFLGAEPNARR